MSTGGRFLSRWSRLKREAEKPEAPPAPRPATPPEGLPPARSEPGAPSSDRPVHAGADAAAPPAELPPLETLGIDADISAYLRKEVSESLRRAALRKLFNDPHFNQMDGLDVYVDDYSVSAPIPADMMKRLRQFQTFLSDEKAEAEPGAAEAIGASRARTDESEQVPEVADAVQQPVSTPPEPHAESDCDTLARSGQKVAAEQEPSRKIRKNADPDG